MRALVGEILDESFARETGCEMVIKGDILKLFAELFRLLNGSPMSEGQRDYMERLLEEIEEGRA